MGDVVRFDRLTRIPANVRRDVLEIAVRMLVAEEIALTRRWLTVSQVSEQTGATHCTVRGWIRDGALKATHWGKSHQWRIRASDLESFLKGEPHV